MTKDMSFNIGIYDTTDVFVDAVNLFGKIALNNKKSKIITGSQEIHKLCWRKYLVEITKSSNVSVLEIIPLTNLQKYTNKDLFVNFVTRIKSFRSAI